VVIAARSASPIDQPIEYSTRRRVFCPLSQFGVGGRRAVAADEQMPAVFGGDLRARLGEDVEVV
jgi:hypothetical protein